MFGDLDLIPKPQVCQKSKTASFLFVCVLFLFVVVFCLFVCLLLLFFFWGGQLTVQCRFTSVHLALSQQHQAECALCEFDIWYLLRETNTFQDH